MDSPNISELNVHDGSRLLSESSLAASSSSSRTGPGGDDLSLSELSISDRPVSGLHRKPKFSLLAQPPHEEGVHMDESALRDEDADADTESNAAGGFDETMTQEDVETAKKLAAKMREEKLQHDLFILRKLNSAFDVYKEALRETKSSTERVAVQLEHTDALLDKYMKILSKSENITRLIMDERWQGAEADEEAIEEEHRNAVERVRRDEEERVLAAQRERERLEREERERKERDERERIEQERAEASKATVRGSGVRGVRGTRASMRGMRTVTRAASTASTRGIRGVTTTAMRRPVSLASVRSVGTTSSARGRPRGN